MFHVKHLSIEILIIKDDVCIARRNNPTMQHLLEWHNSMLHVKQRQNKTMLACDNASVQQRQRSEMFHVKHTEQG